MSSNIELVLMHKDMRDLSKIEVQYLVKDINIKESKGAEVKVEKEIQCRFPHDTEHALSMDGNGSQAEI